MVLKSAADPAVKEKVDAVLGKEDPGAKAPHPREDKDSGEKANPQSGDLDPNRRVRRRRPRRHRSHAGRGSHPMKSWI